MSTHEERLRSLRQARRLLQTVVTEERLSADLRSGAEITLDSYPRDDQIKDWLASGARGADVSSWGVALASTRWVLEIMLKTLGDEDPLRNLALFAERHFPEAMWLPNGASRDPWEPMFLDPFRMLR